MSNGLIKLSRQDLENSLQDLSFRERLEDFVLLAVADDILYTDGAVALALSKLILSTMNKAEETNTSFKQIYKDLAKESIIELIESDVEFRETLKNFLKDCLLEVVDEDKKDLKKRMTRGLELE